MFQVTGDTKFADRTERTAYNALPAEMTPNMWSHQYLQQQNQIGAQTMSPNPFPADKYDYLPLQLCAESLLMSETLITLASHSDYSNVFGLEPNYPCCTGRCHTIVFSTLTVDPRSFRNEVNHPQGFSKFISNAFVVTGDKSSLLQVYIGPFDVKTTLSHGMLSVTPGHTSHPSA